MRGIFLYLLYNRWAQYRVGTIMVGHNTVWAQYRVGTIPWAQYRVGTISDGHSYVWAQSRVGTITVGHSTVWAQSRVGTVPCGHNCGWAQYRVVTVAVGHNTVWAQSSGHNSVGTITHGHSSSGTVRGTKRPSTNVIRSNTSLFHIPLLFSLPNYCNGIIFSCHDQNSRCIWWQLNFFASIYLCHGNIYLIFQYIVTHLINICFELDIVNTLHL